MKRAKTLGVIIALAAFVGGWQLGQDLKQSSADYQQCRRRQLCWWIYARH